jgi:predicted class III extradiol MEMO1 family dioxygenase
MSQTKGSTRPLKKAGEWYEGDPSVLSDELDEWLGQVQDVKIASDGVLPIPQARVIIAP